MIANTFESDLSELQDLASIKLIIYLFIFGLLPSIFVWKVKLKKISFKLQLWNRVRALLILTIVFIIIEFITYVKHNYWVFRFAVNIKTVIASVDIEFQLIGIEDIFCL